MGWNVKTGKWERKWKKKSVRIGVEERVCGREAREKRGVFWG